MFKSIQNCIRSNLTHSGPFYYIYIIIIVLYPTISLITDYIFIYKVVYIRSFFNRLALFQSVNTQQPPIFYNASDTLVYGNTTPPITPPSHILTSDTEEFTEVFIDNGYITSRDCIMQNTCECEHL